MALNGTTTLFSLSFPRYTCNKYDEKEGLDARDSQSRSRAQLQRYLHYYSRYSNHEQSARLEKTIMSKVEKKMEEIQQSTDYSWIEVQFFRKAVDILIECRTTVRIINYLES